MIAYRTSLSSEVQRQMMYPSLNYHNQMIRRCGSNFLPRSFGVSSSLRYPQVRIDRQILPYGIPIHSQQLPRRMNYWRFNRSQASAPSKQSKGWIVIQRIHNGIKRILHRIMGFLRRKFPNYVREDDEFLTPGCMYTSIIITIILIAIGIGLGIALNIGLKYNGVLIPTDILMKSHLTYLTTSIPG